MGGGEGGVETYEFRWDGIEWQRERERESNRESDFREQMRKSARERKSLDSC